MAQPRIGVLAVQGDVDEHRTALEKSGAVSSSVKTTADLARVDGLVIPGGESTTVIRLLERFALDDPIKDRVRAGMPLWGTCMGMIVAAHDVAGLDQKTLDLIDITVRRNAFGRQIDSAEIDLPIAALGARPFPAVFIRDVKCQPNRLGCHLGIGLIGARLGEWDHADAGDKDIGAHGSFLIG